MKSPSAKKESKAEGDEGDDTEAEAPETESSERAAADQPPAKTLKVKDGDKEVDLNLLVKIPVKVAGQETEVTLDELRNNYAGKVAWSERFGEVGRKEQRLEKVKSDFVGAFKEFQEIAEKDGLQALCKLAEMNGQNPIEFREKFLSGLLPQLENYAAMSEDERAQAEKDFKLASLERENETHRRAREEQQSLAQLKSKIDSLQETHQIDPQTFESTFQALESLQKQGKIREFITPEMVVEVAISERRYSAIESALDELNLSVDSKAKDQMVNDLMSVAKANPDLSPEDLKEIALNAWGTKKAQNLSRKIQKTQGEGTRSPARTPANPSHEALSFDDL